MPRLTTATVLAGHRPWVPCAPCGAVLAMWTTPHGSSLLTPCWPPGRGNGAHALRMAVRDVLEVKIPAEGSQGVCVRSPPICVLSYTPPAVQCGSDLPSHASAWSGGIQNGARSWRVLPRPGSDNPAYVNEGSHASAPTPQNTACLSPFRVCAPSLDAACLGAYRPGVSLP
jgi:hypothetical protein